MSKRQEDSGFEDISSFESKSQYNKSLKAKKGRHRGLKVFLAILCVLCIAVGGVSVYAGSYLFGGLSTNKITKDKETLGIASGVTNHPKITNIAMFGLDTGSDSFTGRSDAIMVLSIDQVHGKIKLTSILRDSLVYMGEGYPGTGDGYDKLNHAYAYGGPEMAIRAINTNFHLNIEDYVSVNFGKLTQIVDAFGGVDIALTEAELAQVSQYDGTPSQNSAGGTYHLNGAQALGFARIRYIDSDNKRAERQQIVLTALLQKVTQMSAAELPRLVSEMSDLCESSMGIPEILGYAPFALSDFELEKQVLPGEGTPSGYISTGAWVWMCDTEAMAEQIEEFIYEGDQHE